MLHIYLAFISEIALCYGQWQIFCQDEHVKESHIHIRKRLLKVLPEQLIEAKRDG